MQDVTRNAEMQPLQLQMTHLDRSPLEANEGWANLHKLCNWLTVESEHLGGEKHKAVVDLLSLNCIRSGRVTYNAEVRCKLIFFGVQMLGPLQTDKNMLAAYCCEIRQLPMYKCHDRHHAKMNADMLWACKCCAPDAYLIQ